MNWFSGHSRENGGSRHRTSLSTTSHKVRSIVLIPIPTIRTILCETKRCSYLAFVQRFCATCCKQKYRVEVKRRAVDVSGLQIPTRLGLFATSKLKSTKYI